MRLFEAGQAAEAIRWAAAGGQAVCKSAVPCQPAPFWTAAWPARCARLFDWDATRLVRTAVAMRVRQPHVHRAGTPAQHVVVCGAPWRNAVQCCPAPAVLGTAGERRAVAVAAGLLHAKLTQAWLWDGRLGHARLARLAAMGAGLVPGWDRVAARYAVMDAGLFKRRAAAWFPECKLAAG